MHLSRNSFLAVAVALALASAPAHAVLERVGPVSQAPAIGGFPTWFQDRSGIALEFCDPKTTQEASGGWCVVLGAQPPESFPTNFQAEHFYYNASNDMRDTGNNFRAKLVLAVEAAFANNAVADGNQMTFGRLRVVIPTLPFDGDYRVITPYSDVTYLDQKAGGVIRDTTDIGLACVGTFECALKTAIGPFLLPSAQAGAAEVPPMPDLKTAPPGTDPFYDQLLFLGGGSADPGTGRQYLADPKRVGTVTGSPLPDFIDSTGATRNHNTFRIEVRAPSPTHDGAVFYTVDGESNFTVAGRLLTGTLPGKVTPQRASYKADATGAVTDLDVFAKAVPTTQARLPGQPQLAPVTPVLSFYDVPCAGALGIDPETGLVVVNPQPWSAPAGTPHPLLQAGSDFWSQSQPGGTPPSHVCIVDTAARDANGQAVPAYYLQKVSDFVAITAASYEGAANGTLTVNATSSDPTAVLTLAGYGPNDAGTPGVATAGKGAGTGLDLAGNTATVKALLAPAASLQVVSSRGGFALRDTATGHGTATGGGTGGGGSTTPVIGTPVAVNDTATLFEDCSAQPASICAVGAGITVDLIANDTVLVNGNVVRLRDFIAQALGTVTVAAQAPRLGLATMTADGIVSYTPNANANGTDAITYTVSVNGQVSNQAILTLTITPVNDLPVAGSTTAGAVIAKANTLNLIATATDPDGNADVKDAVLLTWPAQLGPQPVPAAGVLTYTPTTAGTFTFTYQVKDAAGALSANTGTATVTVAAAEAIAFTKQSFTTAASGASNRWVVSGTDSVREGQVITIAYADGKMWNGTICDGSGTNASCVVGTTTVDATGNWLYDHVGTPGGPTDPTDSSTWVTAPRKIRAFSSAPVLGGSASANISFK